MINVALPKGRLGEKVYAMFEKAPQNIEIQFPMKEGVISHFYNMQYLLQNLIKNFN